LNSGANIVEQSAFATPVKTDKAIAAMLRTAEHRREAPATEANFRILKISNILVSPVPSEFGCLEPTARFV
jgi:hypothetical protein